MFLGAALFVRGAMFVAHPNRIFALSPARGADWFFPALVGHYVGIAHVSGGLLLAVGMATRLAAVVQIPILLGAVFLVHWNEGLLSAGQSLELSTLVLVMLVIYAVFGTGKLSIDYYLSQRRVAQRSRVTHYT
jgi:uncharacterized membrane protein YphA (DoxX/SURF4 family)